MMATYTNRPISKAFQLAELKNRGLVVGDDNQAIEYLTITETLLRFMPDGMMEERIVKFGIKL